MNLASLLFAALVVSACGRDSSAPPQATADTLVVSSDTALVRMAAEMLPDLASRSGLSLRTPVRIERRSRAQLEAFLRMKLDEELPESRARSLADVYSKLGLMPAETDLRSLLLSVYQEQVAGFYDPDSTALFVLDDQSPEALEPVLLHELVHAVQDQWTDLDAATAPELGNDRATAAQAAIEGHATLVMFEYIAERAQGRDLDLTEIPGFGSQMRAVLEAARSQYPQLASAPRIVQEGMLFPYLEGAGFVLAIWRDWGHRDGPFEALLPVSTEQVMDPSRFLAESRDDPATLTLVAATGEVLYQDGLGQLETRILLEEITGGQGGDAAAGWDGDGYILVSGPGEDSTLAWASVWDDIESRDRFVAALTAGLPSLPQPASVTAVAPGGRPGALLLVGPPLEVGVTVSGGDGS